MRKAHVSIIGAGQFASVMGNVVAQNVADSEDFDSRIVMYVYEPPLQSGRSIAQEINENHLNVSLQPPMQMRENLVASTDLAQCAASADFLIFASPHQYLEALLEDMKVHVKRSALAISLSKGFYFEDGELLLATAQIETALGIPCLALGGPNVADQIASCELAETTIGYRQREHALPFCKLFGNATFKVRAIEGVEGVQTMGALKNIVALGVGFAQALGVGSNTTALIMRRGISEMFAFTKLFFPDVSFEFLLESCGIGDLITSCTSGRNLRCAKAFALGHAEQVTWASLERTMLNGMSLQGPLCLQQVHKALSKREQKRDFTLFEVLYQIAFEGAQPALLLEVLSHNMPHYVVI
uniref:Glycerol-3-phosphate dehydrogenase [NAD(+)] n=1 Tax=Dermatophagoides pteronyssinus TaxID=6956 RepID=A0A6P6Y4N2_DERPT|nr:glycerol-3-phosphate dehydrogenase [NAD(+)]-like [Dermatophagoides pteronyssinus]